MPVATNESVAGPSNSSRLPEDIALLGLGVIGAFTALAILQRAPTAQLTIYEVRSAPATIGGALNISPNAHRTMAKLGVAPSRYGALTPWVLFQNDLGQRIGEFKYGGSGDRWADGYEGMRAQRSDIQVCWLMTVFVGRGLRLSASRACLNIVQALTLPLLSFLGPL